MDWRAIRRDPQPAIELGTMPSGLDFLVVSLRVPVEYQAALDARKLQERHYSEVAV